MTDIVERLRTWHSAQRPRTIYDQADNVHLMGEAADEIERLRARLEKTQYVLRQELGAPGDWGYESTVGKGLYGAYKALAGQP